MIFFNTSSCMCFRIAAMALVQSYHCPVSAKWPRMILLKSTMQQHMTNRELCTQHSRRKICRGVRCRISVHMGQITISSIFYMSLDHGISCKYLISHLKINSLVNTLCFCLSPVDLVRRSGCLHSHVVSTLMLSAILPTVSPSICCSNTFTISIRI